MLPSKVAKMDLNIAGNRIGYIMGAGDKIPESLRQIGYRVDLLETDQLTTETAPAIRCGGGWCAGLQCGGTVEISPTSPFRLRQSRRNHGGTIQHQPQFGTTDGRNRAVSIENFPGPGKCRRCTGSHSGTRPRCTELAQYHHTKGF